jgi:hypothetical protein
MTTEVIRLADFRKQKRLTNGTTFPQLYRVRGYYLDGEASELKGEFVAGPDMGPPCYSFSDTDPCGYQNPRWEPIHRLDPEIDKGWVVIRRHLQAKERMDAYLDGIYDMWPKCPFRLRMQRFLAEDEGFTIVQREEAPPGLPDHLLIFISKIMAPVVKTANFGLISGGWMDFYHIVFPDGTISNDGDSLYPPEDEE